MLIDRVLDRLLWRAPTARRPDRALRNLRKTAEIDAPLDETFAFFSDARNLERLTPPWLAFVIRTPMPVEMRAGLEIDYRIVLHGRPIPWRSVIEVWEPGRRFVDVQVLGPYRWWRHEHTFESIDGGRRTRMTDHVEFIPRVPLVTGWLVERDVSRIFDYREQALARLITRAG